MMTFMPAFIDSLLPLIMEYSLYAMVLSLGISKALVEISITALLISWWAYSLTRKNPILWPPRLILLLMAGFLATAMISLTYNHAWDHNGLRGMLKWSKYLAVYVVSVDLFQNPKIKSRAIYLFLIAMAVISFNGFFQLKFGYDFLRHQELHPGRIVRIQSSLGSPNQLAAFYLISIPLSFGAWNQAPSVQKKFLFGLIFSILSIGLILTFSRSAFYALAFIFLADLLRRKKRIYLLTSLGIMILALVTIPPLKHNYLKSIQQKDLSLVNRMEYWKVSWKMIQKNPWLGVGLNQYYSKAPETRDSEGAYRGYAHNSYLQLWAEGGLPAVLFFIALVISIMMLKPVSGNLDPLKKNIPWERELALGLGAFLIQACFDNNLYALQSIVLFWLMIGGFTALKIYSPTQEAAFRDDE